MRILLDECLDWRLMHELPGHHVQTVQEMGWSGTSNGQLLALAQSRFEVFVTTDQNLPFQQNISAFSIAVVILQTQSARLVHTRPLMAKVAAMLPTLTPGNAVCVSA